MVAVKQSGPWVYEDLLTLPDDGTRYEIINGEFYKMPAPGPDHAFTLSNLFELFLPDVRTLGGRILLAPIDVFVGGANPVQPDFLILLPDRLASVSHRGIEGPPNLVLEVVSPSNPTHDRRTKRTLYARGGVPEYWLVDPERRTIEVLVLADAAYRRHDLATGDALVTSVVVPGVAFPAAAAFG